MRAVALWLILTAPALACECVRLTACEIIRQPIVFIGEVIEGGIESLTDDPWYSSVDHVRFKVIENFRGLPRKASTVDLQLHLLPGMCSPIRYYPGKRYLVVPGKRDRVLSDGACFGGEDVEKYADEVKQVRDFFTGNMGVRVYGQVGV